MPDDDYAAADETDPGSDDGADTYIDDEAAADPSPSNKRAYDPQPGSPKRPKYLNKDNQHTTGYFPS